MQLNLAIPSAVRFFFGAPFPLALRLYDCQQESGAYVPDNDLHLNLLNSVLFILVKDFEFWRI